MLWVVLSTQLQDQVYTLHEPTRFVLTTGAQREFLIPGVPPGSYYLYLQSAAGSITDIYRSPEPIVVRSGPVTDLGVIEWTPSDIGRTLLWQIGQVRCF